MNEDEMTLVYFFISIITGFIGFLVAIITDDVQASLLFGSITIVISIVGYIKAKLVKRRNKNEFVRQEMKG